MGDTIVPQHRQQIGRGVGFYGVQRLARKLRGEELGSARSSLRTVQNNGFGRRQGASYSRCIKMNGQCKGPPIGI